MKTVMCGDPRSDFQKAANKREEDAAWLVLNNDTFTRTKPHRLINGIAISSAAKNANGVSYRARGLSFDVPVPLLWNHDFTVPLGQVTHVWACGEMVTFTAEIMNCGRLQHIEDLWTQLKERRQHGVSIHGRAAMRVAAEDPNVVTDWRLREVSIVPGGADAGARLTSVRERSPVVCIDARNMMTVFWSEAA